MTQEIEPSGRFRRGLFVMLVVLGLLAAGGLLYGKGNATKADEAKAAAKVAEQRVRSLLNDIDRLTKLQERLVRMQQDQNYASVQRSEKAAKERAVLDAEIDQLRRLILQILSESRDPQVRRAARRTAEPSPPPPSFTPSPAPKPRPTPSPTPTCQVSVRGRCVVA